MPFIIKFYEGFGFTMAQIIELQAFYSVSMLLFEIPSGYSADMLGRRKTLILGTLGGFLGFSIYCIAGQFWQFAVAEVIMGLGMSFISGADSAMLYDSLYDLKKDDQYSKYEGRVTATGNYAEALAGIVGSFIAFLISRKYPDYGLQGVFIFQAAVAFTGVPAAIFLIEPKRHTPGKKEALKNIIKISKFSLIDSKDLRYNILYSSLMGSATLTMAWFVQKLFIELGITHVLWLAVLWAFLNITVGTSTLGAYKFDKKLGSVKTMLLISLIISFGYMLLIFNTGYFSLLIIVFFYFGRGIATPVLKDYINRLTTSEVRATVLSIRSFIIRIIFSIFGPFIGYLTDSFSIRNALFLTGIFYFVVSMFLWFKVKKLSQ